MAPSSRSPSGTPAIRADPAPDLRRSIRGRPPLSARVVRRCHALGHSATDLSVGSAVQGIPYEREFLPSWILQAYASWRHYVTLSPESGSPVIAVSPRR